MINLDELTEAERRELMRQMVNYYERVRYANRTPEQIERDRIRKREYMCKYRERKKAEQEE